MSSPDATARARYLCGVSDDARNRTAASADDTTLAGYLQVHERPPAFHGSDGHPYSVEIEVERTPDLRQPWDGFLVFPRWSENGLGIIGHLETPTLWRAATRAELMERAGAMPLVEVQQQLEAALRRAAARDDYI